MKFKLIALPAQDNSLCETFQRLAFSFGYQWSAKGKVVQKVDPIQWLSFDPNTLLIEKVARFALFAHDETATASNTTELLSLLSSPPACKLFLTNTAGTISADILNGQIRFIKGNDSLTVDNETIKLVSEYLNFSKKPNVPLVRFEYPESARNGLPKIRFVRLTALDDTYLKGYEVSSANSKEVGEFKNFVKNRILQGGTVEVVKFSL